MQRKTYGIPRRKRVTLQPKPLIRHTRGFVICRWDCLPSVTTLLCEQDVYGCVIIPLARLTRTSSYVGRRGPASIEDRCGGPAPRNQDVFLNAVIRATSVATQRSIARDRVDRAGRLSEHVPILLPAAIIIPSVSPLMAIAPIDTCSTFAAPVQQYCVSICQLQVFRQRGRFFCLDCENSIM
jgi:hypothetical protein